MRPPLRVEAKVAEELRNWLTSELERLDASNTNPFAHHVVTILLQEDLDIDDEPLSTDDRLVENWGIRTVRRSKNKDNKVKAAVQFLRSAIASEETIESDIELIVNNLVLRIEATKQALNSRKSRGRELLGALTINIDSPVQKPVSKDSKGERSYNEVFPSLPGETPSAKSNSTLNVNPNNSVWNRSPPGGKENRLLRNKRTHQAFIKSVRFIERAEVEAYHTAAQVFVRTLSEACLPQPETMEVPLAACGSDEHVPRYIDSSFWRSSSAFCAMKSTSKLFIPRTVSLPSLRELSPSPIPPQKKHVIMLQGEEEGASVSPDPRSVFELLDPGAQKVFLPVENLFSSHKPASSLYDDEDFFDEDDLEVMNAIQTGKTPNKRMRHRAQPPEESLEMPGFLAFPGHHKAYFNDVPRHYPLYGLARLPSWPNAAGHAQARGEPPSNSFGAIGCPVPGRNYSWGDVKFTNDLVGFADEQMNDDTAAMPPDWDGYGAVGGRPPSHKRIASSDSGVVVSHGSGERTSASPRCEPPLSAPASLRLLPASWPQGSPRAKNSHDLVNDPLDPLQLPPPIAGCWDLNGSPKAKPWPDPPEDGQALPDLRPTNPPNQMPSTNLNGMASVLWVDSLWSRIQETFFPVPAGPSFFDPAPIPSSRHSPHESVGDLTAAAVPTSVSSFAAALISHDPISESSQWPTPSATCQMISEPQGASYFPPSSASHFMPSGLLPGSGMENTVAQMLQTAYVNSIFSRAPLETAPSAQSFTNAFNCADLENSWFSASSQSQHTPGSELHQSGSMVQGQTCSKWLEGRCDLGLHCPFSHPRL